MKPSRAQLQDFCQILQGGRHGKSGNDFVPRGFPAYGAGGLNGYLKDFEFERPAVVLSSIGARCGKCFYVDGRWSSLANTQVMLPDLEKSDPKFLWFQLNDESRWHRSGTAQPFIKPSDVKTHEVFLPTLPEQRRIAAILDQADVLRAKRREALAQLDSLTQSVFIEMFGDPAANPMRWAQPCLGELIESGPQNGLYKPSTDYGSGTPILRIDAFYDGAVTKLKTLKRVRVSVDEARVFGLRTDDVVINRVNSIEYLGKSALIPALQEPTVFESNMMRFRVAAERVLPTYLVAFLQTPFIKEQIRAASKDAVNQSSINQQDVKAFKVGLPPVALQQTFATRIHAIESLKSTHRAALAESDALFASLQHRAFAGQLQ